MKISHIIVVASLGMLVRPALGDDASARALADKLITLTSGEASMHAGFNAAINGLIQNMTQHGLPQAGVDEVRAAVDKWYADEIKFSEVEPKIAAVYVKDFSEAELKAIVDFYQTPAGQKAIKLMPMVMQDSAQVAQDYTSPKIPSLNATLTPILMKYQKMANAAAGGAPGAGGPGAGMPPAGGGPGGSGN